MRQQIRWLRRAGAILIVVAGLIAVATLTARGTHSFSDVPTSAFYHNAVEWVFNRGITAGCAAGLYCPDAAVTRGQMAVFLQKEGQVLTPGFAVVEDSPGPLDPDSTPIICQTATTYTPSYPQRARVESWVSLLASGAMGVDISTRVSNDGGASWLFADANLPKVSGAAGEWMYVKTLSIVDMIGGTGYRFAVDVARISGTADATDSRCEVSVTILNRNPTTSPLAPRLPSTRGR